MYLICVLAASTVKPDCLVAINSCFSFNIFEEFFCIHVPGGTLWVCHWVLTLNRVFWHETVKLLDNNAKGMAILFSQLHHLFSLHASSNSGFFNWLHMEDTCRLSTLRLVKCRPGKSSDKDSGKYSFDMNCSSIIV